MKRPAPVPPSFLFFATLITALAAGLAPACKREQRDFQGTGAPTQEVAAPRLSQLQPGQPTPPPTVPNGYEETAFALSEGKQLFSAFNCVGCHAHGGGAIGPALMDDRWRYGSRPEQVFSSIMEGRPNGMPSFRGRIMEKQAWEITAYVRSLSGLVRKDAAPNRDDHMKSNPPENSVESARPKDSADPAWKPGG